jgi:UDP-hydrolysing UDP-N-acetyl-D-glucosamine 2-epimerase
VIKLAFLTGARSDYGPFKSVLKELSKDNRFDLHIIPHGMHLLEKFGMTIDEIYSDNLYPAKIVKTYRKTDGLKHIEFTDTIKKIYTAIINENFDAIIIVGDRIEAYGAALAAHFAKIPIVHSGGGHITSGAVDDIYRNNISMLADYHLTTSKNAYENVLQIPTVTAGNVYFVGSPAVDGIYEYFNKNEGSNNFFLDWQNPFALMTFHSVTAVNEPVVKLMEFSINYIIENNFNILITYPNNDEGSEDIISFIESLKNTDRIYVSPHLGVDKYYAALSFCKFVIGNSSSGIMEAPYFHKPVLNVGTRQKGRAMDVGVFNIPAEKTSVKSALEKGFILGWPTVKCNGLYGKGESINKIKNLILKIFTSDKI